MRLMIIIHSKKMDIEDLFSELRSKSAKGGKDGDQHQLRTAQVAGLEKIWAEALRCQMPWAEHKGMFG